MPGNIDDAAAGIKHDPSVAIAPDFKHGAYVLWPWNRQMQGGRKVWGVLCIRAETKERKVRYAT